MQVLGTWRTWHHVPCFPCRMHGGEGPWIPCMSYPEPALASLTCVLHVTPAPALMLHATLTPDQLEWAPYADHILIQLEWTGSSPGPWSEHWGSGSCMLWGVGKRHLWAQSTPWGWLHTIYIAHRLVLCHSSGPVGPEEFDTPSASH